MLPFYLATSAIFLAIIQQGQCEDSPHILVDVGYTKYQGLVNLATGNTEFLGIRYAAPPLGNLRWRQPQVPQYVEEVQLANIQPKQCFQAFPGTSPPPPFKFQLLDLDTVAVNVANVSDSPQPLEPGPPENSMTEDCLFLNVYSPGGNWTTTSGQKRPVVVWIHGGGYILGSASGAAGTFDGNDLIRQSSGNVVVVVIQYRLGLFGFLAGKKLKQDGVLNPGLIDQEFALNWVQDHISKFGGDPSKVTIWGESAGAGSVLQHLIAHEGNTEPPLFRGAILSSPYLPPQYPFDHDIPESMFSNVLALTGCSESSDPTECLRAADPTVLQAANLQVNNEAFSGTFAFVPVVDGTFIKDSPSRLLSRGKVNTKHILVVTNTDEGRLFVDAKVTPESTPLEDYLSGLFPGLGPEDGKAVTAYYKSFASNTERFSAILGDAIFVCPAYTLQSAVGGGYKAVFAIHPSLHIDDVPYYFPSLGAVPQMLGYLFGVVTDPPAPIGPRFPNPEFIQAFAQSFMDFAINLDPNVKSNVTSILPKWPKWTKDSTTEMLFNRTGDVPDIRTVVSDAAITERCAFWASVAPFTHQ
ncbi:cephalosporin esterase [Coprinopsis marcescibilis]|uniref:Carboxylic ester hydrolase n=1 Tax=Coprinopsis marcescibilis TaxID=230819 RepID=A0A5C3LH19_COPMA|nr:cephalosporin esterase [Coprinopsis marcescibilis]